MSTPVQAHVIDSQVSRIQIPTGLRPGDSFIVTPTHGRVFTVVVPPGAVGGSFIEVVVPDEAESRGSGDQKSFVTVSKATVGAAVVAGVVGAVLVGPVVGLLCAGGAAYATTKDNGKVGDAARKVGDSSYKGMCSAKKWVEKKIQASSDTHASHK